MATRGTIALEFADGSISQVYSHWDNYPSHNGRLLQDFWSDPWKLRDLIDCGDLSVLGKAVGSEHDFSFTDEDQCTFYGRDRGETGTEARRYQNYDEYVSELPGEEFDYILRQVDGAPVWFVRYWNTNGTWIPLAQAFEQGD